MLTGRIRALSFFVGATLLAAGAAPVSTFETAGELRPNNRIDELVFAQWKKLGIQPANLCSDSVFVRRAYLDVIGTLPTAQEAAEFIASTATDKRAALIDRLLERDEFADYWAMKWSDLLRVKAEFPINLWPNAAQAYYHWIRDSIRSNKPYDQFVREMLTGSGSNFRTPPVNFYRAMQNRAPDGIAQTVTLTFMGARADKWPKEQLSQMARFFSQIGFKQTGEWKEEIVYFDPAKNAALPMTATLPNGSPARFAPGEDPREVFAAWLVTPQNPWFTRNIVNRVWCWLLGRGIVHEADDIRADNPPENPELLAWLEHQLAASHYDLKRVYQLILNSTTYQLSSIGRSPDAAAHFAAYAPRRLDAEVLADALNQITGTSEEYSSAIPEPYTFMPDFQRAISLPDGSISSSFLELFGRPPRDTGLEAERNNRFSNGQRLHMLNSSHVQRKVQQGPKLLALMQQNSKNPKELVTQIYLTILSRYPTEEEFKMVAAHSSAGVRGPAAAMDLIWALLNGKEFLYRH